MIFLSIALTFCIRFPTLFLKVNFLLNMLRRSRCSNFDRFCGFCGYLGSWVLCRVTTSSLHAFYNMKFEIVIDVLIFFKYVCTTLK